MTRESVRACDGGVCRDGRLRVGVGIHTNPVLVWKEAVARHGRGVEAASRPTLPGEGEAEQIKHRNRSPVTREKEPETSPISMMWRQIAPKHAALSIARDLLRQVACLLWTRLNTPLLSEASCLRSHWGLLPSA